MLGNSDIINEKHCQPDPLLDIRRPTGFRSLCAILFHSDQVPENPYCIYLVTRHHLALKTESHKSREEEDPPTYGS